MTTERDAYFETFKAQLDQLNAKFDSLAGSAIEAKSDARIKYEKEIEHLREKRDAARSKLDELRSASGEAWHDLKDGFERSWRAFSNSVPRAVERLG